MKLDKSLLWIVANVDKDPRFHWFRKAPDALPNYLVLVKTPMDLERIKNRIQEKKKVYTSAQRFREDILLIEQNAKTFNGPLSEVSLAAEALTARVDQLMREVGFLPLSYSLDCFSLECRNTGLW